MNRRTWVTLVAVLAAGSIGFFTGRQTPSATPASSPPRAPLIGIASVNGDAYVQAIREAGGIPVILPDHAGGDTELAGYLERLDGLLLPGGADIPPAEYGEAAHPTVEPLDPNRFGFEKVLGRAWIEQTDKPLLGICLGSQWINVLHGGSLVQDIPSEKGGNHRGTTHTVKLEPGTRLHTIYGDAEFEVNSWHHQAVDGLGSKLRVAAISSDGVIEATESIDPDRFLIGVQWHPEKMLPDERQARLLKAFVEASKEKP
jgi:putative glutamine amidotransferase